MVYFLLKVAVLDLERGKPCGKVVLNLLDALVQVFTEEPV